MASVLAPVRLATIDDIPSLMDMGRTFHADAYAELGALDEAAAERTLRTIIASHRGIVLMNDHGAIGGIMAPMWFQPKTVVMEECFWWAPSGGGKELMLAFVARAKEMGATAVMVSTLDNERAEAAARVARRYGFAPIERRHILRF